MTPVEARGTSILIPALLLAFAACDSDPTGSDPEQSQLVVAFASLANTPHAGPGAGPHIVDCPAGGRIVIDGDQTRESDGDVSIVTWDRSTTLEGCALARPDGTAIADGQMQNAGEVRFGPPVNQHAPVIYHLATQRGSMTTTFRGASQTCEYDLVHTLDVDINRYRISGTVCGRELSLTAPPLP